MRSRLDRCDGEHAPAYLEASKAELVPYYQRFGFEQIGEIQIPDGPNMMADVAGAQVGKVCQPTKILPALISSLPQDTARVFKVDVWRKTK